MTRCFYCHRFVWPWQRQGHRYLTDKNLWRWHSRCWRLRHILPKPMPSDQAEWQPDARPATYRRS